mmetsp:Transcript_36881/g.71136  ORF Transcript_36881/g.71136 Transcript_36881/m.71136 type:complete len:429 (-) Transcript_36881:99-1385(-)
MHHRLITATKVFRYEDDKEGMSESADTDKGLVVDHHFFLTASEDHSVRLGCIKVSSAKSQKAPSSEQVVVNWGAAVDGPSDILRAIQIKHSRDRQRMVAFCAGGKEHIMAFQVLNDGFKFGLEQSSGIVCGQGAGMVRAGSVGGRIIRRKGKWWTEKRKLQLERENNMEIRILALDVFGPIGERELYIVVTATSVGKLCVYTYQSSTMQFALVLQNSEVHMCPILSVKILERLRKGDDDDQLALFLVTGDTRGRLVIWSLEINQDEEPSQLHMVWKHKIHQSGVNALCVWETNTTEAGLSWKYICILTGGDDQTLHLLHLRFESSNKLAMVNHIQTLAHHSAVKCVAVDLRKKVDMDPVATRIWSSGYDQVLKCWEICSDQKGCLKFEKIKAIPLDIPDVSAIDLLFDLSRKVIGVLAVGHGMQTVML